ncbi:MAG: DUF3602 domain-containing protein [Verrucomicrobia bacterium]|nr:DUF3602 domain-containing protein [Verrucomicrobiota bacterium]
MSGQTGSAADLLPLAEVISGNGGAGNIGVHRSDRQRSVCRNPSPETHRQRLRKSESLSGTG